MVDVIMAATKKWISGIHLFLPLISYGKQMQLLLNVGGANRVSRLQMAESVARIKGYNPSLIKPVSASSISLLLFLKIYFYYETKLDFKHDPYIENLDCGFTWRSMTDAERKGGGKIGLFDRAGVGKIGFIMELMINNIGKGCHKRISK
ncbi:hypothetical protein ZIOFF_029814 [Zingiber officinale]|uniref:Uncharacterized protein n=1 Tax=Zingiber officinale TaxID=94328 RepID=A0A8J5LEN8_ZINOF|nr:hypothetical protein ZIOFF_029814 [Zingiber officinale]